MKSLEAWFEKSKTRSYTDPVIWNHLEQFVLKGDAKGLKAILKQQFHSYGYDDGLKDCCDADLLSAKHLGRFLALDVLADGSMVKYWLRAKVESETTDDEGLLPIVQETEKFVDPIELRMAIAEVFFPHRERETDYKSVIKTSAIRYVLAASDKELKELIRRGCEDKPKRGYRTEPEEAYQLALYLALFDPERMEKLLPCWFPKKDTIRGVGLIDSLLVSRSPAVEKHAYRLFNEHPVDYTRLIIGLRIHHHWPDKYAEEAFAYGCELLRGDEEDSVDIGFRVLESFGERAVEPLKAAFAIDLDSNWGQISLLGSATEQLAEKSAPLHLTALTLTPSDLTLKALETLISFGDAAHDDAIHVGIEAALKTKTAAILSRTLTLAGRWQPERYEALAWKFMGHSSKGVREAAARLLAGLGESIIPKASEALVAKKAATREAAVSLLRLLGSDEATKILEDRLDEEGSDAVRDLILLALESAWEKAGRVIDLEEIRQRIQRFVDKGGGNVPDWLDVATLPPLYDTEGNELDENARNYLVYRQSRAKDMRPDVEVKPFYQWIDRERSGDFALETATRFLSSSQDTKDRWSLALAGLLGDDRLVSLLLKPIREWPKESRHKLAEYATQALALIGSNAALMAVDSLSIRFRSKFKNIGKAAAEAFCQAAVDAGITPEELGDRVVPRLGFEKGETRRVLEGGGRHIEVSIGPELKFVFKDTDKSNKIVKTLPKALGDEIKAEFKERAATLREVAKAQKLRLENLLVQQHRWPADRWQTLFLKHPVCRPFGSQLIWATVNEDGSYSSRFRALEDGSLTDDQDEDVILSDTDHVVIAHPLMMTQAELASWAEHVSDYEVLAPFGQLDRPIVTVGDDDKDKVYFKHSDPVELAGMTFHGRAERLGWYRGSVVDAGGVANYYKSFPGAGVDVFIDTEGMYIGMGEDMMKPGPAFFVKHGSVAVGSYVYDEPSNADDERFIRFGDVPPLVYSEAISEIGRMTGVSTTTSEDE